MKRLRTVGPLVCALIALAVPQAARAVEFSPPQFVDRELAGGEPLVLADGVHHTLVYTSHEGTTHLYRPGIFAPLPFGVNYRNQVNIWTSSDDGASWQRTGVAGASADPTKSNGFSDPDLTMDEGGRIYNTGINLVSDSVFSSIDGGKTYDKGNPNCHNGDRPWLAGGKKDEVFLATNTAENVLSHQIFTSTDGGDDCSTDSVPDTGMTADGGSYTGAGKLYYSHVSDRLIEPIQYLDADGVVSGVGVGTWSRGDKQFTPHKIVDTTMFAHWPAIALDKSDNVYAVWDDNPVDKSKQDSCGSPQPTPNNVKMSVSRDFGQTWSTPITVAHTDSGRVFWPWIAAGDTGKVSVVWYQSSKIADLDCEDSDITIGEAQILNATAATPTVDSTMAGKRLIHAGSVCQGGTTCVAENKDRRLGDFFTNSLDARGCVLIASGDTTQTDPTTGQQFAYSLPIFIRQTSGEGLVGGVDCATGLPKPTPAALGQCRDVRPPVSTLTTRGLHRTRRVIRLKGRSKDRGCAGGKAALRRKGHVEQVLISIARVRRHGCRFLTPKGRLQRERSCKRPTLMPAKGTTRWHFSLKLHPLPAGNYRAVARGVDASQNKERPGKRRNVIRFRVR
ncbi:MAG: hypothetical protein QOC95_529 [Thermoleophilaceae bacterium]|nr:hypothetical protein [Thermoleophilaceae bacterium]